MALTPSTNAVRPALGTTPGAGFSKFTRSRHRLIVMVQGKQKTGKTHFALTAESDGLLKYQSFNLGLEGVIDRPGVPWNIDNIQVAEYDLTEFPVNGTDTERAVAADSIWQRYLANQYDAIDTASTVVVDFEADAWELFRVARSGRENPEKQAYLSISPEYRRHFNAFLQSDCNLIVIEPMKEEWKGNKATGKDVAAGFKDMPYVAQVIVETYKRPGQDYGIIVRDCRINPELEGMELPNDFVTLKEMVWGSR